MVLISGLLATALFLACVSIVSLGSGNSIPSQTLTGLVPVLLLASRCKYILLVSFVPDVLYLAFIWSISIGPIAHFHENSIYYSAIKSSPNKAVDADLPHVTIELPVYNESLTETCSWTLLPSYMYIYLHFISSAPSVYSLKMAMQTSWLWICHYCTSGMFFCENICTAVDYMATVGLFLGCHSWTRRVPRGCNNPAWVWQWSYYHMVVWACLFVFVLFCRCHASSPSL